MEIVERIPAPDFSGWLTDAVEAHPKKPDAIAVAAGISSSYLYRLMRGRAKTVSREVVSQLETALGVKYVPG